MQNWPKRPLQIVIAILGLIPLATGLFGMMGVDDPVLASASIPRIPLIDSELRFFSGLWLGVGITLAWLVPRIDTPTGTSVYRILWGMIFLGGIGRLLSMAFIGMPPAEFIGFTALEIIGAPLFVVWQSRIGKSS
jgi:Domain of unknown function (DUF4345)